MTDRCVILKEGPSNFSATRTSGHRKLFGANINEANTSTSVRDGDEPKWEHVKIPGTKACRGLRAEVQQ